MTPEIGYNGKRFKIELRDVIQIVVYIVMVVGMFYAMRGEVAEVRAWGDPPAGRLYVLETDVARHHNVTEAVQDGKIAADHDKVMMLEVKLDNLTKELERNNRLLERLLNKR